MGNDNSSYVNFERFDFDSVATTSNYINRGDSGKVYGPFTWNSRECALKKILISAGRTGDDLKIKLEATKNMKHKNLLEIHNVVLQPMALYIVMEYASGGSLRRLLNNVDAVYCQIDVSNWARQIAEGMLFLLENCVVHRDLKSGNSKCMSTCFHHRKTLNYFTYYLCFCQLKQ